jgi:hypothetical protein
MIAYVDASVLLRWYSASATPYQNGRESIAASRAL